MQWLFHFGEIGLRDRAYRQLSGLIQVMDDYDDDDDDDDDGDLHGDDGF